MKIKETLQSNDIYWICSNFLFFIAGIVVNLILTTSDIILTSIFIKLSNAFSPKDSKGALDTFIRIIDTIATTILAPLIWVIIYFWTFIGHIGFSYNHNLINLVEINEVEYGAVNNLMDEDIQ